MSNRAFSLLIKPTSADCNLRCAYCFYLKKSSLYPDTKKHRMTEKVLEALISSYMATDQPIYAFGWQGGEPSLMGLVFFKKVISLQEKYGKGKTITNGFQTNGTLIDDALASFFSDYRFLVGISLDGPRAFHDKFRLRADGAGSYEDVINGVDCLKRNKVDFNVLTLVNSANVGAGRQVYNYLCDLGIAHHQYIPCVEFDAKGSLLLFAITGEAWGEFLCEIFDEWINGDAHRVSVRHFDAVIEQMLYGSCSICTMSGHCSSYFVIEHNGDVYSCDFFVDDSTKLGNISDTSWQTMQGSNVYKSFGQQKHNWNKKCYNCEYLVYCSGDCTKHRLYGEGRADQLSWLCKGWKMFYRHSIPRFKELAKSIISDKSDKLFIDKKLERNDRCFCGSGKKYKKCHGMI